jgi:predicted lipoprotein with Yx(FWY)xxD motif
VSEMPTETRRRRATATLALVLALLAAACGSAEAGLGVATTELGDVIVDADGFTLYLLIADQQRTSTCDPVCAEAWPPVSPDGLGDPSEGLDPERIGTIARADGAPQVTYNGWPLYRFTGDVEPGQANGHGILNAWFAITPVGGAAGPTR